MTVRGISRCTNPQPAIGCTWTVADELFPESSSVDFKYYRVPTYTPSGQGDIEWKVPEQAICVIDTWVQLFYINVVFGLAHTAVYEKSSADTGTRLRGLFDRRPFQSAGANVTVGEGCHIDPGTQFSGNVVIGDNVTIGPGCVISVCIVGDNVSLAHGNRFYMCVLSDNCFFPGGASAYFTAFMENSTAGQNASLEMSLVGRNSYIGAGTILRSLCGHEDRRKQQDQRCGRETQKTQRQCQAVGRAILQNHLKPPLE